MKALVKAEALIALAIAGFSLVCMVYALELPIGWVPEEGPGGGAFPFWLSAVMLSCALAILFKAVRDDMPDEPFFDPETRSAVFQVALAVVLTIAALSYLGAYIAIPVFMVWYLRLHGQHSWTLTGLLTLGTVMFVFFFFEVTLKILLPKGVTEPLFLPLYAIFF
ncbi:MAG: tripartite tricarboxylate transporter TctB family protein [Pseudomonadota bacterium]